MVFFNYTTMQVTAKIVYYGPGLCGKTTNLQFIHQKTAPKSRGEMISLETETDRTLFFDLLPLEVGVIGGMKVRLQVYTVPGQVFYNATRKLVLKGVDGIVFVADSQVAMIDANVESRQNLEANLAELGVSLDQVAIVFQYNKRDIRNIHPVETLDKLLNSQRSPYFEAAALHGIGVFETLKEISRLSLASVRKKVATDDHRKKVALPPVQTPAPKRPPAAAAPRSAAGNPLADLVPDPAPVEEIPVEFADAGDEQATRPVEMKGQLVIMDELEKLRSLVDLPAKAANAPLKDVERRLQDMLVSDRDSKQDVKRKCTVEIPGRLLRESSVMRIRLSFDAKPGEETVHEALTVKLLGNRKLERLSLHLDLEVKGKG